MYKYWNYVVLVLLFVIVGFLWFKQRVEFFEDHYPAYNTTLNYENTGPSIFERHPVYTSIQQDMKFKNDKVYNYELENDKYRYALFKTFDIKPYCTISQEWAVVEPVSLTIDPLLEDAYKYTIDYITNKVKVSEYLKLPDGQSIDINPIQTVHDRFISYKRHKTLPSYILELQVILYREGKSHGKDITFMVRVDRNKGSWKVTVLDATINGVIFEDKIGLFPVNASDPLNKNIDLSKPFTSVPLTTAEVLEKIKSLPMPISTTP